MEKWFKKVGILLLVCVMFFVTACSSGEPGEGEVVLASSSDEAIELTMYYPVAVGGPLTTLIEEICADFTTQNPNITIKPVYCGSYAETMTKTQTAINGENAPDLGVLFSVDLFTLMDMDAIEPLDDYIASNGGDEYLNDFFPSFMENGQAEGKTWGLPFQRSTIVMYYNKDAFEAAGLDPEAPPTTWAELAEYAEALTQADESGNVTQWGLEIPSTGYQYWMHQALAIQSGKNVMNGDGTEVYYDSDEAKEALQYWVDLSHKYKGMPEGIIEWKSVPSDFLEEKTAMMFHSTGNLTNVKNKAEFNFGVAMLPANKTFGSPTGGGNFYIFKDIDESHKEAAWKFIEYATSPEVLAQWSMDTGYVAPRASAYETEALKTYVEDFPYALVAKEQLDYAKAELSTHSNGEVQKIANDYIQAAITGSMTVDEAMGKAQEKAEEVLSTYK